MTKGFMIITLVVLTAAIGGAYITFDSIKEPGYESCVLSVSVERGGRHMERKDTHKGDRSHGSARRKLPVLL